MGPQGNPAVRPIAQCRGEKFNEISCPLAIAEPLLYAYPPGELRERIYRAGLRSDVRDHARDRSNFKTPDGKPLTPLKHPALQSFHLRTRVLSGLLRSTLASLGSSVKGFEDYDILTRLTEEPDAGWAIGWRGEGVEGVEHTLQTGRFTGAERVHKFGRGVYLDL